MHQQLIYSKSLDCYYYLKEYQLFHNAKKRVKTGKLRLDSKYLKDLKVFIELIRTATNYDAWINGERYSLVNNPNGELIFYSGGTNIRQCVKINKYNKKMEYFYCVKDLAEDVGYDVSWVFNELLNNPQGKDGHYYCYIEDVDKFLETVR